MRAKKETKEETKKISPKTAVKKPAQAKEKKKKAGKKTAKPEISVSGKTEKTPKQAEEQAKEEIKIDAKIPRYYEAVGRRKRAVARVRLFTRGGKEFVVNEKEYTKYFSTAELAGVADGALRKMKVADKFGVSVRVSGGGVNGQAEAVRLGIARALVKFNQDFRKRLKRAGYLRRDPREVERKKFGLKKARRAPQWAKR